MTVTRLCSEMVQIQSENPPGDTREIISYIDEYLQALGISGTITENDGGRWNLFVSRPDFPLLLCGHVDVVPAVPDGWSVDPLSGEEKDGYIWGRGSTDMKGGVAAILAAIEGIVNSGEESRVNLAFVCDEETSGEYGIRYLVAKGYLDVCDCLIAEPTPPLNPCNGQKGLCQITVRFKGEPGHGSMYPHVGVSAIMEAFSLLEFLRELNEREYSPEGEMREILETSSHVLEEIYGIEGIRKALHKITFNPGRIEGGEKSNIVAQRCTLDLDIRVPWGCRFDELLDEISRHAPRAEVIPVNVASPSYTPQNERIVQITCQEIERFFKASARPIVQWAASDARFLRKAGFPALEYGPGEITTLHGRDERTPIASLTHATEIYKSIIRRYSQYAFGN